MRLGHNSSVVAVSIAEQIGTQARVLVVDDDSAIRRMIVAALRREGPYAFLEAANGKDALDLMRDAHPDVVVLDLMMPILSGWDVLRERSHDASIRKIPVILVSANRDPEIATAVDAGICAFLPKPFDIAALSALVRSCIPAR
jgi:two-component system phosphate regulon response regulator PhoB/two-component system alkaline phosphatase synthesis response regulator PhoP